MEENSVDSSPQSEPRKPSRLRVVLIVCGILTVALAISLTIAGSMATKYNSGIDAMEQREAAECEAKGGTYTAQPLYNYAASCVAEGGYYLHLDAYTQGPREKILGVSPGPSKEAD